MIGQIWQGKKSEFDSRLGQPVSIDELEDLFAQYAEAGYEVQKPKEHIRLVEVDDMIAIGVVCDGRPGWLRAVKDLGL